MYEHAARIPLIVSWPARWKGGQRRVGACSMVDLEADPGEFTNLVSQARHGETIRRLHATLVKELGEDPEQTEKRCRADLAKGYDRGGKEKKQKGKKGERQR